MSARRIVVELTEPQVRALVRAAGDWEDQHDPDEVAGDDHVEPGERRLVPVLARARRALLDALHPSTPLPFVPEHPLNRV